MTMVRWVAPCQAGKPDVRQSAKQLRKVLSVRRLCHPCYSTLPSIAWEARRKHVDGHQTERCHPPIFDGFGWELQNLVNPTRRLLAGASCRVRFVRSNLIPTKPHRCSQFHCGGIRRPLSRGEEETSLMALEA